LRQNLLLKIRHDSPRLVKAGMKPSFVKSVALALAIVSPALPQPALSQQYPAKPVRLIVGFAPGGVVDTPTRIVATKLGELWGTTLVVENRPAEIAKRSKVAREAGIKPG